MGLPPDNTILHATKPEPAENPDRPNPEGRRSDQNKRVHWSANDPDQPNQEEILQVTTNKAKAFVSKVADMRLCAHSITIGKEFVETSYQDSCATHNFLSPEYSNELTQLGYAIYDCPPLEVEQGTVLEKPTTKIHLLRLMMISPTGGIVTWEDCLFLVAEIGADVLIGNPILENGNIMKYEPPAGYKTMLMEELVMNRAAPRVAITQGNCARNIIRNIQAYSYPSPTQIKAAPRAFKTAIPRPIPKNAHRMHLLMPIHTDNVLIFHVSWVKRHWDIIDPGSNQLRNTCEAEPNMGTVKRRGDIQEPSPQALPLTAVSETNDDSDSDIDFVDQGVELLQRIHNRGNNNTKRKEPENEGNPDEHEDYPPSEGEGPPSEGEGALRPIQIIARYTKAEMDEKKRLRILAQQEQKEEKQKATTEIKWGREPPQPDEIKQALDILKTLSENPPEKAFEQGDLEEIRQKLHKFRPEWAQTLTRAHTEDVYDNKTKAIIEDLMDNRFRQTVFIKSLKIPCDFNSFDIPQKEGYDSWAPPQPIYYKCPAMAKVVNQWQDGLTEDELITTSTASRPARVTVAHKEGREDRVCVDYRNRNLRSIVPVFPMPQIHDHLDEAIGFKFYCSFDCSKMFNQFEITEKYRPLAAFMTHRGVYEPKRVMFGLQGGPQHAVRELSNGMLLDNLTNGVTYTEWALQQNQAGEDPPYEMDPVLKIVKGSRLRPFVDDVKVMSNHLAGMAKLSELLFMFCEKHHIVLSRKKAKVGVTHLKLLGMVVSEKGKHLDPDRIISLLDAHKPRSREGLHSLLCSYNFVRMFVPNFGSIAAPLYNACKGIVWKGPGSGASKGIKQVDPDFLWSEAMNRAYGQLQNALLEAPILVAPDWLRSLFLSVDASLKGEGWCLWQLIPTSSGKLLPVAIKYGSMKYTSTEAAWEVTRQEVSAMRNAIVDVQEYLFGQHFYLLSDHRNLQYMHNSINRAVIRIRHFLSQFNMTVIHCPGCWNNPADGISRMESPESSLKALCHVPTIVELQPYAEDPNPREIATIHADTFFISRWTDMGYTGELTFCPDDTDRIITANLDRKSIQALTDEDKHREPSIQVLLTQSQGKAVGTCRYTACWLCQSTELLDGKGSDDESREKASEVICFKTQRLEYQGDRLGDGVKPLQAVIVSDDGSKAAELEQILRGNCCQELPLRLETIELYTSEARLWNDRLWTTDLQILRPSVVDEPFKPDKADLENVLWCGLIERNTAKVFLARGSAKRKQHLRNMKILTKSGVYSEELAEKALRISIREKDTREEDIVLALQWLNLNSARPGQILPREDGPVEINYHTLDTQTTPADFRSVEIRIPIRLDFIAIHNNESGHHGVDYSYRKLLARCGSKWANEKGLATQARKDLRRFIDECPICQKIRGLHSQIPTKHSFIVSRPFLEASYDFIVFDKPDMNGKRYILVFIDNFSKLVEIKATKSRDAATVAKFLIWIKSRYGPVARLRSDKAAEFIGLVITKLNESSGTTTCPCIAYHPQANSICERQNGIVMYHLRCLCYGCKLGPETVKTWSDLLPFIFSIVNNTPKLPLTISPLSMVFGIFANYDRPLIRSEFLPQGATVNSQDYFEALCQWQVELLEVAETIQEEHLSRLAHKYRLEESTERAFNEGDFILQLKTATSLKGKPTSRWAGPKLVVRRRDNDPTHPVVDLLDLTTMRISEASIEDCRIFHTGWFEEETLSQDLTKLASLDREEYEVERIISHRPVGEERLTKTPISKYTFEVKWVDFPDSENSWEPYNSLKDNCTAPLGQYSDLHPGLRIPKEANQVAPPHQRAHK